MLPGLGRGKGGGGGGSGEPSKPPKPPESKAPDGAQKPPDPGAKRDGAGAGAAAKAPEGTKATDPVPGRVPALTPPDCPCDCACKPDTRTIPQQQRSQIGPQYAGEGSQPLQPPFVMQGAPGALTFAPRVLVAAGAVAGVGGRAEAVGGLVTTSTTSALGVEAAALLGVDLLSQTLHTPAIPRLTMGAVSHDATSELVADALAGRGMAQAFARSFAQSIASAPPPVAFSIGVGHPQPGWPAPTPPPGTKPNPDPLEPPASGGGGRRASPFEDLRPFRSSPGSQATHLADVPSRVPLSPPLHPTGDLTHEIRVAEGALAALGVGSGDRLGPGGAAYPTSWPVSSALSLVTAPVAPYGHYGGFRPPIRTTSPALPEPPPQAPPGSLAPSALGAVGLFGGAGGGGGALGDLLSTAGGGASDLASVTPSRKAAEWVPDQGQRLAETGGSALAAPPGAGVESAVQVPAAAARPIGIVQAQGVAAMGSRGRVDRDVAAPRGSPQSSASRSAPDMAAGVDLGGGGRSRGGGAGSSAEAVVAAGQEATRRVERLRTAQGARDAAKVKVSAARRTVERLTENLASDQQDAKDSAEADAVYNRQQAAIESLQSALLEADEAAGSVAREAESLEAAESTATKARNEFLKNGSQARKRLDEAEQRAQRDAVTTDRRAGEALAREGKANDRANAADKRRLNTEEYHARASSRGAAERRALEDRGQDLKRLDHDQEALASQDRLSRDAAKALGKLKGDEHRRDREAQQIAHRLRAIQAAEDRRSTEVYAKREKRAKRDKRLGKTRVEKRDLNRLAGQLRTQEAMARASGAKGSTEAGMLRSLLRDLKRGAKGTGMGLSPEAVRKILADPTRKKAYMEAKKAAINAPAGPPGTVPGVGGEDAGAGDEQKRGLPEPEDPQDELVPPQIAADVCAIATCRCPTPCDTQAGMVCVCTPRVAEPGTGGSEPVRPPGTGGGSGGGGGGGATGPSIGPTGPVFPPGSRDGLEEGLKEIEEEIKRTSPSDGGAFRSRTVARERREQAREPGEVETTGKKPCSKILSSSSLNELDLVISGQLAAARELRQTAEAGLNRAGATPTIGRLRLLTEIASILTMEAETQAFTLHRIRSGGFDWLEDCDEWLDGWLKDREAFEGRLEMASAVLGLELLVEGSIGLSTLEIAFGLSKTAAGLLFGMLHVLKARAVHERMMDVLRLVRGEMLTLSPDELMSRFHDLAGRVTGTIEGWSKAQLIAGLAAIAVTGFRASSNLTKGRLPTLAAIRAKAGAKGRRAARARLLDKAKDDAKAVDAVAEARAGKAARRIASERPTVTVETTRAQPQQPVGPEGSLAGRPQVGTPRGGTVPTRSGGVPKPPRGGAGPKVPPGGSGPPPLSTRTPNEPFPLVKGQQIPQRSTGEGPLPDPSPTVETRPGRSIAPRATQEPQSNAGGARAGAIVRKRTGGAGRQTGGRAGEYASADDAWAAKRYDEIRSDPGDVDRIAGATGLRPENIQKVKKHVFEDVHVKDKFVDQGVPPEVGRFDPDPEQVRIWERLQSGRHTQDDIGWLKHEIAERKHMELSGSRSYGSAHDTVKGRWPSPLEK